MEEADAVKYDDIEREIEALMHQHTTNWRVIRFVVPALAARVRERLEEKQAIIESLTNSYESAAAGRTEAQDECATLQAQLDARERDAAVFYGALGHPVPDGLPDHLSDGTTPINALARTLRAMLDSAEQEIERLKGAMSTHHELDEGDLGRSCLSRCWVCTALAPPPAAPKEA